MQAACRIAQHNLVLDHHEVHGRSEGCGLVARDPHIVEYVLLAVALPPKRTRQFALHSGDQFTYGAAGDPHSQRDHIRHHSPGAAQHGGMPT